MNRNGNLLDYMHWHVLVNWYMLVNWNSLNMMMMDIMCMHVVWHCRKVTGINEKFGEMEKNKPD